MHIENSAETNQELNDRKLGDEWSSWDGKLEDSETNKNVYILFSGIVIFISIILQCLIYYLIEPRLRSWHSNIPYAVLGLIILISLSMLFWYLIIIITNYSNVKLPIFSGKTKFFLRFMLNNVLKFSKLIHFSQDRISNSFVKVSNNLMIAIKKKYQIEKLLVLAPRCLEKSIIDGIKNLSTDYNFQLFIVSGGELARKKVLEYKPTAIIGIACERDLISGIKDVGIYFNVIGIPNCRPNGPCKNTQIDIDELKKNILNYLT